MQKGQSYSLRPEDPKRRLADDLARLGRDAGVAPVVIGGLAVNHHGYMRLTADVDILVSRAGAAALTRKLKAEPGWKRYAEGFKNTILGVSVDLYVEGDRTSPHSTETFPDPAELDTVKVKPLPVAALPDLLALKVMSGQERDDADVVELLKRHSRRIPQLRRRAAQRLRTDGARRRLDALVQRAAEELARRRR